MKVCSHQVLFTHDFLGGLEAIPKTTIFVMTHHLGVTRIQMLDSYVTFYHQPPFFYLTRSPIRIGSSLLLPSNLSYWVLFSALQHICFYLSKLDVLFCTVNPLSASDNIHRNNSRKTLLSRIYHPTMGLALHRMMSE